MKRPKEFWANHMAMHDSEGGARDFSPRAEWQDLRCYVGKSDYDALLADAQRLAEALERIQKPDDLLPHDFPSECQFMVATARAALAAFRSKWGAK